ncbi:MAG: hypothetical protein P8Q37_05085 [Porticoccaceae bacterium]|nr:hypothetical protein [Porticoccaceae bacterium]MDG1474257.1 hypothetical protein [Porticoccaceae bacterium]
MNILRRITEHLHKIYTHHSNTEIDQLANELINIIGINQTVACDNNPKSHWNQKDIVAITYADSILDENKKPLNECSAACIAVSATKTRAANNNS